MDDYKIALGALLDANAKGDIDKQLKAIKDLSVTVSKATLDQSVINDIKRQLSQNGIDLKLVFGNVGQINSQAQQVGQQIGNNIGQQITQSIGSAIQKGTMQIVNGKDIKNLKEFKFDAKSPQNDVAKQALKDFQSLGQGIVTVKEEMKNIDGKNLLNGFTINIKNAKGEVESLRYALKDIEGKTGKSFQYVGGTINDAGAVKQFEQLSKVITDYQTKLDDLKTKYSNANVNYSGFEKVFNDFKQGVGTVNDLKLAFNQLQNSAKLGVQSLKSQSSSFDPIQQTLNNMRDLPSRLQALQADMGGLKDKTAMADISIKDLTSEYQKLQSVMTNSGGKVPLADNWTESYRNLMSILTSAENQVKALKKAEASDNSQITKQANYYSTILSNYRQIYSLKQKLLTAGKEETNVIKEQIRSLSASNASINKQLGAQGLKSKDWESEVSSLKEQLRYSYMISEAKQKDIADTKKQSDAQKQSTQMTKELATAYQKLGNLKVQKGSLDTLKDAEKIAQLTQEIQKASQEYNNLYNTFRKRKNFDSSSWKETKSAIDSATKSQIEYNNAKAKDVFNSAKNNEISNLATLKSKWQEQGVLVGEFKTKVEQLENSLVSVGSKGELNNLKAQMESLKAQASQIADVNKIQLLSNGGIKNDYATQIAKLEGDFRSLGLAQDTIATKTQNVKNSLATLRAEFAKPVDQQNFQAIQTANDNLQRELIESRNEFEQLRASMKGMATEQQRLSLANTIEAWNQKNTAATKAVREENERYVLSLRDLSNQMTRMDFNKINTGFKQNENSMRALNRLGASLKDQFTQAYRSFTMWLSASTAVMKLISETREAVTELKEVDTILTEISKTNHSLTSSDLTKIADNGFDVASKYGKTVTDYLSGVKDMSRAGYRNAEAMGELSTAVQGAGDMTADVANKMIIATDKAYKLGGSVEELTKILDGMNWISDNNAVNMTELSEGMSIVGSTAASFGVEVNELTAALATMTASTQQSGSEVARAFRAILLNIRQVSDEEEGIDAEGLTKYEKACNALGVSLKETVNGVLQTRDAMEVLEDLSVAYNKLDANDLRRTNLLNSVGGKLRSTQLDALLRQFDSYKTMLQQFEDGTGTMAFEADKTAKSWEGSLNRLKNTWADTIENIANSDGIIAIINGLNGIISGANKLTDTLGSLGSVALGAGIFAGVKNFGKTYKCMVSNRNCFEYALHA